MTFSAQLMNGFGIVFKPLVIFTPHFAAILENCGLAWKTTALLHFRHFEKHLRPVRIAAPNLINVRATGMRAESCHSPHRTYPATEKERLLPCPDFPLRQIRLFQTALSTGALFSGFENYVA
ncbi:hypothetical protein FY136_02250 [Agrobacterium tumefaciens]|uniref:hypothetical protein n=1 Tax=Agrobacterium tumefaciens TaxID=358 RepID=UPI0021D3D023|nr:hypothetical protein [Agrobacterium tumefaciens]UXT47697.1 hypothetical protein FY136_02250 [Agrobacterium tumefaciens]